MIEILEKVSSKGDGPEMLDVGGSSFGFFWVIDGATPIGLNNKDDYIFFNSLLLEFNQAIILFSEKANGIKELLTDSLYFIIHKYADDFYDISKFSFAIAVIFFKQDNLIEYFLSGDCYLVINQKNKIKVLVNEEFLRNSIENKLMVNPSIEIAKKYLPSRRKSMNKIGGYKIGTFDTGFFNQINVRIFIPKLNTKILLCSDGFVRIVENYHLYSWNKVLNLDLEIIVKKIREIEATDQLCLKFPRIKCSDDIMAIKLALYGS